MGPPEVFNLQVREWEEQGKRGAAGGGVLGAEPRSVQPPGLGLGLGYFSHDRVPGAPEHPVCCFGASFVSQLCQFVPLL